MNTNVLSWMAITIFSVGIIYFIIVALTDGRYFGKWLMNRIYDFVGPSMFSAQSEAEEWRKLAQNIKLQGDEKILDVGTAVGDLPVTFAAMEDFDGEVIGIDRSETMIARARSRVIERGLSHKVRFEVVDIQDGFPYREGEFDVIICLGLLETVPRAEKILKEFAKILKPKGVIVTNLYRGWASKSVALSYEWYEEHFLGLGFREIGIHPCRRNHDAVIARR